ncbi:MAG: hypothetical protein DRH10_06975 [Deltaproteobacteria bacterium]|nr:MAG: hypothetical protein DRH10_06975 [Deltaproteobacteria bacterium]
MGRIVLICLYSLEWITQITLFFSPFESRHLDSKGKQSHWRPEQIHSVTERSYIPASAQNNNLTT